MPVTFAFMRELDEEHQSWCTKEKWYSPKNGEIPVGGGDWMDAFFKGEALRGTLTALRNKKTLKQAIQDGKAVCEIAIQVWNGKREWQVRRDNGWIEDFIQGVVDKILVKNG